MKMWGVIQTCLKVSRIRDAELQRAIGRRPGSALVTALGLWCLAGCQVAGARLDSTTPTDRVQPSADVDADKAYVSLADVPPAVTLPPPDPQAVTEASSPTIRRLASAEELMSQQRYTEAISTLEKALRYDPLYAPLHRMLGAACRRSGALGRASSFLDKALQLDPADLAGHYHRALVAAEGGESEVCLEHLRLAWLGPSSEETEMLRALVAWELGGKLEEAGYLSAAAELYAHFEAVRSGWRESDLSDPDELDFVSTGPEAVALRIGRIQERLGRLKEAGLAYRRALGYAPEDVVVQTGNARLLMRTGRRDQARIITRRLLAAATSDREWNEIRALYRDTGHRAEFLEDLRKLAAEPAPSARVLEALLDAPGEDRDIVSAGRLLRKLVEIRAEDGAVYTRALEFFASRGLGRSAMDLLADVLRVGPERMGLLEEAVDRLGAQEPLAQVVLRSAEKDWSVTPASSDGETALCYLMARLALRSGAEQQARTWLEEIARRRPDYGSAYPLLGELYVRQGRWTEAIELIREGLKPEEALAGNAEAQLVLARAYRGLDAHPAAEEHFEAAVALRRDDADIVYELGRLLENAGKPLRARRQYQAALALDASHEAAHESLVRNFLARHETRLAREQLTVMKQALGTGAALERCQALWDYYEAVRSSNRTRREITGDYVHALTQLAEQDPADVSTRLDLALALCEPLREYDRAAAVLDEVLGVDPHNTQGLDLRVLVHRRELEFERVPALLEEMLARHPNRHSWLWQQAQAYLTLQDYDSAAGALGKMLAKAGQPAESRQVRRAWLGALTRAGRYAEAEQTVRTWEDQSTEPIEDGLQVSLVWREILIGDLLGAGANDPAVDLADEWYEETPDAPEARAALMAALLTGADSGPPAGDEAAAHRLQRAMYLLMEWLEDDPDNSSLNRAIIGLLTLEEKHRAAVELARNWMDSGERRSRSWMVLATALMSAEEYGEAIGLFKQWARTTGESIDFQRAALAMIQAGRHEQAERYILNLSEQMRAGAGQRAELSYLLYTCYFEWGKADFAEQQLAKILEELEELSYEPDSGVARRYFGVCNDLGYLWADQGRNLERAERMIRQAVSSRPREAAYLDSLGWVRYKRGDAAGALKWLEWAARAQRNRDAVILEHLGDTYWRLGRRAEARDSWRQALDLLEPRAQRDELSPDEQRAHREVRRKLEQLELGEEPAVAEFVEEAGAAP